MSAPTTCGRDNSGGRSTPSRRRASPGQRPGPRRTRATSRAARTRGPAPIVDTQRGIVFIATGSPADDFYGVDRPGDNLYGNCVIALDANTGKKLWHFQATRHDLWDSDFAAPPILLTVNSNGRRVDAVAATNKWGFIYIFDRVTGESLFPITEIKVPTSTVPGEITSPTQPVPTLPAPLAKQTMTRDEVTGADSGNARLGPEGVRHVPGHEPALHAVEHRQTDHGGARLERRRRVGLA